MLSPECFEILTRMFAVSLQACDQRQFEFFFSSEKIADRLRRQHLRKPCRAALLDRLDRHGLPFCGLATAFRFIELQHDSGREKRHDAGRPEFCSFLNDGLDEFAFWNGLEEGDLAWRLRLLFFGERMKDDGVAAGAADLAHILSPSSIKHLDPVCRLNSQNAQGMISF